MTDRRARPRPRPKVPSICSWLILCFLCRFVTPQRSAATVPVSQRVLGYNITEKSLGAFLGQKMKRSLRACLPSDNRLQRETCRRYFILLVFVRSCLLRSTRNKNVLNYSSPIFCITHSEAQGLRHAGSSRYRSLGLTGFQETTPLARGIPDPDKSTPPRIPHALRLHPIYPIQLVRGLGVCC